MPRQRRLLVLGRSKHGKCSRALHSKDNPRPVVLSIERACLMEPTPQKPEEVLRFNTQRCRPIGRHLRAAAQASQSMHQAQQAGKRLWEAHQFGMVFPWMWSKKRWTTGEKRVCGCLATLGNPRLRWDRTRELSASAASRKAWQGCPFGNSVEPTISGFLRSDRCFDDRGRVTSSKKHQGLKQSSCAARQAS